MKKLFVFLIAITIIVTGCSSSTSNTQADDSNSVKIQYLGHSAFILESSDGTRIGIDFWNKDAFPYAEDVPDSLEVSDNNDIDRLLITHSHSDHTYVPSEVEVLYGNKLIEEDKSDEFQEIGNVSVGVIRTEHFHPTWNVGEMVNGTFILKSSNINVVHLGDAHGTMVDTDMLKKLKEEAGEIDVLLMPIGSPNLKPFNIAALKYTMDELNPRIVVPIHYWKLDDKQDFLSTIANDGYKVEEESSNSITFTIDDLPEKGAKVVWSIPAGTL